MVHHTVTPQTCLSVKPKCGNAAHKKWKSNCKEQIALVKPLFFVLQINFHFYREEQSECYKGVTSHEPCLCKIVHKCPNFAGGSARFKIKYQVLVRGGTGIPCNYLVHVIYNVVEIDPRKNRSRKYTQSWENNK
eukprot:Phypoly_transcript_13118.p2 GENE.Phypoly_transcript_13118~~Phypoly_transcript_13118.p2  ORF type:complete len:134 (-),score=10.73 Phypoly_transcript_13118:116-517(-)